MFELADSAPSCANIKVIGVGGGGGNAVEHMLVTGIDGVEFICANTDMQALERIERVESAQTRIMKLGEEITKGLGAGANPEIGRQAALESRDAIEDVLEGTDMVFITAGMGGGTGTGGAPIVAEIARNMGILTVAVVTKPFVFEGKKRSGFAEKGIQELAEHVDSLIVIPNDRLLQMGKIKMTDAFGRANDVLCGAVRGISELITSPGLINVDFADVRTVMSENGLAKMGAGIGKGENAAVEATELAIKSPLLEDVDVSGARGILVNITAGEDFDIMSMSEIGEMIHDIASDDATVVIGTAIDETLNDEVHVTFIATGLENTIVQKKAPEAIKPVSSERVEQPVREPRRAAGLGQFHNAGMGDTDRPAVERKNEPFAGSTTPSNDSSIDAKDVMNIPSFLRTQAD
ncbi:MAG: cell division protein FtsZ [Pseudomonadota bacterium]|nr:cell division protein FtsZ [Pseudomonadota bacterium]